MSKSQKSQPDRESKLRRLNEIRRSVPYVSASALSAVLNEVEHDMPTLFSRKAMRESRDIQVNEITPYRKVMITLPVELNDGTTTDMNVVNAFAQLWVAAKRCNGFSIMLLERLNACPSTYDKPWRFILYSDEVVPGNQMSFHNFRKCWAVYWSFMEFGESTLSVEDAWFCMAAERSESVKAMGGGITQVFRELLRFLFAPGGHSLRTCGVLLEMHDGTTIRIWAKLEMILQDGDAHKQVHMIKGDAGHKMCMECRNLYSRRSNIVNDEGEEIFTCSLHLMDEMDFATDADVHGTVHRLADVAANRPGELKLREQACGFNHHKFNMSLRPDLDGIWQPVKTMAHDWMHTFVVHGVWNTVMFLLLIALQASSNNVVPLLHSYIAAWILPLRLGTNLAKSLADVFNKSRWSASSKAKYLKCTASDAISMYAIVACFVNAIFVRAGLCVNECRAYILLCDVLDMLMVMPRGHITYQHFHEATDKFLRACVDAGWADSMHPKFHWILLLVRELRKFGMLLTCWVHERKHRMVKRYTNNQRNTRTYERSVLAEITCQHMHCLSLESTFNSTVGLRDPISLCTPAITKSLQECLGAPGGECTTSKTARVSKFEVVRIADVVVFRDVVGLLIGQIKRLVAIDDLPFAIIEHWPLESKNVQQGTVMLFTRCALKFISLDNILTACTYTRKPPHHVQVIVPCIYRQGIA